MYFNVTYLIELKQILKIALLFVDCFKSFTFALKMNFVFFFWGKLVEFMFLNKSVQIGVVCIKLIRPNCAIVRNFFLIVTFV